jgi:hypothetical protein
MRIPSYVWFKEGKEKELLEEFQQCLPRTQMLMEDMGRYFVNHGHQMIVTDIMSDEMEDEALGRVSKSHREGRAFDFRTRGLSKDFLDGVEKRFEHIYKHWAAISAKSLQPELIVYHNNGNGQHGHVQIRSYK